MSAQSDCKCIQALIANHYNYYFNNPHRSVPPTPTIFSMQKTSSVSLRRRVIVSVHRRKVPLPYMISVDAFKLLPTLARRFSFRKDTQPTQYLTAIS